LHTAYIAVLNELAGNNHAGFLYVTE